MGRWAVSAGRIHLAGKSIICNYCRRYNDQVEFFPNAYFVNFAERSFRVLLHDTATAPVPWTAFLSWEKWVQDPNEHGRPLTAPMPSFEFFLYSQGLTGLTGSGAHLYKEAYLFQYMFVFILYIMPKRLKNLLGANGANGDRTDDPSVKQLPVWLPVWLPLTSQRPRPHSHQITWYK